MKAQDVIATLKANIPRFTDRFSDTLEVTALSQTAGVATAITSEPHGLGTGDLLNLTGALTPNVITSLTRAGAVASAVTALPHDLSEGFQSDIPIEGAAETEYNGMFPLLDVPNRLNFSFTVPDAGATTASGAPILLEDRVRGYMGLHRITVTGDARFTYPVNPAIASPAKKVSPTDIISARTLPRIAGAASLEDAVESYTEQTQSSDLWIYVVPGQVTVRGSRFDLNTVQQSTSRGADVRQLLIARIALYVFSPVSGSITRRAERDDMEEIFAAITRSIGGMEFPTYLACDEAHNLMFASHEPVAREKDPINAYIHAFNFEQAMYLGRGDLADQSASVAFRDIYLDLTAAEATSGVTGNVDLDDEPL